MQQSTVQSESDRSVWEAESLEVLPIARAWTDPPETDTHPVEESEETTGLLEAEASFGQDESFEDVPQAIDDKLTDHLQQYMREAGKSPLLTLEAEKGIARRIEEARKELEEFGLSPSTAQKLLHIESRQKTASDEAGEGAEPLVTAENLKNHPIGEVERRPGTGLKHRLECIKRSHDRYIAARNEMTKANLRLVIAIARRYTNRGLSFPDLVQEGNVGLMKAAEKFDWTMGHRFSTYAIWWIKQSIRRATKEQTRTIHVPTHAMETAQRVAQFSRELSQNMGREAFPHEIAAGMGLPVDKIREALYMAHEPVSLNAPAGGDEGRDLVELIEDKSACGSQEPALLRDLVEGLDKALSSLTDREEKLIRMRFGIGEKSPHTLEELAQEFSLTRERVRQIEGKALKKLRCHARALKP